MFFHKQYREYNSEKEREAELCKQTEIVSIPIRLNRKPSQLAVYSEPGFRGSGVVERALPGQPTDRWSSVRRQVTVEAYASASRPSPEYTKVNRALQAKKMSSFLIIRVRAPRRPNVCSATEASTVLPSA